MKLVVRIRVAICSGLEWGTKILKWGTHGVQFYSKWATTVGYAIFFSGTSNWHQKSVSKSVWSAKRLFRTFFLWSKSTFSFKYLFLNKKVHKWTSVRHIYVRIILKKCSLETNLLYSREQLHIFLHNCIFACFCHVWSFLVATVQVKKNLHISCYYLILFFIQQQLFRLTSSSYLVSMPVSYG